MSSNVESKGEAPDPAVGNTKESVGQYLISRFTTLKPPMNRVVSPWTALRMLNRQQWQFFLCAWFAWMMDAFDFFTASLTITYLAKDFHKSNSEITWGITLVLMLRSAGSTIFGIWSDRFGRRWPFVFNLVLFIVLEIGTGFCKTYSQFLACRALFGIAMGGIYGNAAAMALEDCPGEARGLISGLFQAAYPVGYLFCTVFSRALVNTTGSWRPLYWFSAGPPVLIIIWRLMLPETQAYREREVLRKSASDNTSGFVKDALYAVKNHWLTLIYLVLLMAGCNYMTHGAQDFYPTLLLTQFGFTPNQMTITQVIANIGCACGATFGGYLSQVFGRRFSVLCCCVLAGALAYPYTYVRTPAVAACAFFLQFSIQGAFGVMPGHLMELAPPVIRTFVVGTTYQLGNLASSPAAQLQAKIAEEYFPLPGGGYDYAVVICAILGASIVLVMVVMFLGPERKGRQFGIADELDEQALTSKQLDLNLESSQHMEVV